MRVLRAINHVVATCKYQQCHGTSTAVYRGYLTTTRHVSDLSSLRHIPPLRVFHRSKHTISQDDTIYALSTAPGRAAIAVVRVSGPAALRIYEQLCPGIPAPKPRTAALRRLHHPKTNTVLDTGALVLHFPAPNTVTGEDVLELHIHGGNAIVRGVLRAIPKCVSDVSSPKVRAAEPGEFTKRAFYNSRLDMTEVEALGESLNAETEQQRRLAVSGASSALATRYEEWRSMLLYARGELEALIDFSEDQHFEQSPAELMDGTTKLVIGLKRQIEMHILNSHRGELLRSGINVALLGAPNAGKSSLLNLVVGREAAIVSAEEGTTRDIVDVSIDLKGWLVNLGDMAGVRSETAGPVRHTISLERATIGAIELEGIRRARERALQADLVVVLVSLELDSDGRAQLVLNTEMQSAVQECHLASKHIIFAVNKIDILHEQSSRQKISLSRVLDTLVTNFPFADPNDVFCLSCKGTEIQQADEDSNGLQNFLTGLTNKFRAMTQAATGTVDHLSITEAQNYWTASLNVTHRQQEYLKESLTFLNTYLASLFGSVSHEPVTAPLRISSNPTSTTASPETFFDTADQHYHVDGHEDLIAEKQPERAIDVVTSNATHASASEMSEVNIVTAAEHLRAAADSLSRLTGRGDGVSSGTDVEDVLGVVFEKISIQVDQFKRTTAFHFNGQTLMIDTEPYQQPWLLNYDFSAGSRVFCHTAETICKSIQPCFEISASLTFMGDMSGTFEYYS